MIKLSRMADYGVVLMTRLAQDAGTLRTAPDLAAAASLPIPTASKILKLLTQEGLLDSHRGTKGGYALARPAAEISVADIIGAVDGPISLTECGDSEGVNCDFEALCPTRTNWQRISEAVAGALRSVSLAEMAFPDLNFMTMFPASSDTALHAGEPKQGT